MDRGGTDDAKQRGGDGWPGQWLGSGVVPLAFGLFASRRRLLEDLGHHSNVHYVATGAAWARSQRCREAVGGEHACSTSPEQLPSH
jgi:hypothetical protein